MNHDASHPRWQIIWHTLIEPSVRLLGDDQRRDARLLAAISSLLLAAVSVILPIWIISNPGFSSARPIAVGIAAAIGIAYGFSRTHYFLVGTYILIGLMPCMVMAIIIAAPGPMTERMLALDFLVLGVLLASILLSARQTTVFAFLNLAVIVLFFFVADVRFAVTYSYIVYTAVMSALFIVTAILRNQYLRQLHQSERRYRSLFEQSNDAVFILSLDGVHQAVNRRAADMLGYTPAEVAGLSFREVVAESEQSKSAHVMERLLARQIVPPYERLFRKKDGTVFPVEINAEVVWDDAGNPIYLQSVVRDITERKLAQEQTFAMSVEQERVRLLAQFIRNTSHEFRTPLSVINTNLYLLLQTTDEAKRQNLVDQGKQQISRLSQLLDMMLLMTKLDSTVALERQPTHLNPLIDRMVRMIVPRAAEHHITLTFVPDESLPRLEVDSRWLAEAVKNVLENAIRFTPEGGAITVRTDYRAAQAVIEVEDNGIGIDPAVLPHIFERFWRLDDAHSTPGFGLGLSMAQKIIEGHGGTIEVTSSPGTGSLFTITLPI